MRLFSTVLMDADDTLLDFERAEDAALMEVLSKNGLRTDAEFVDVYKAYNRQLWERYNRGEIPKKQITETRFVKLFDHFSIEEDGVAFNEKYVACLANYGICLPGARELCKALHAQGLKLYIITNGSAMVQKSRFLLSGLSEYFSGVFISDEIGIGKPHKAFFDHVLNAVEEKDLSKIIVVGDSLTADICGGIGAGLPTCWCNFKNSSSESAATYTAKDFTQLEAILLGEQ